MNLHVFLFNRGADRPFTQGRFGSSSALASALEKHAPFERGGLIVGRITIMDRVFELRINLEPRSILALHLRGECQAIAKELMEAAQRCIARHRPELLHTSQ